MLRGVEGNFYFRSFLRLMLGTFLVQICCVVDVLGAVDLAVFSYKISLWLGETEPMDTWLTVPCEQLSGIEHVGLIWPRLLKLILSSAYLASPQKCVWGGTTWQCFLTSGCSSSPAAGLNWIPQPNISKSNLGEKYSLRLIFCNVWHGINNQTEYGRIIPLLSSVLHWLGSHVE